LGRQRAQSTEHRLKTASRASVSEAGIPITGNTHQSRSPCLCSVFCVLFSSESGIWNLSTRDSRHQMPDARTGSVWYPEARRRPSDLESGIFSKKRARQETPFGIRCLRIRRKFVRNDLLWRNGILGNYTTVLSVYYISNPKGLRLCRCRCTTLTPQRPTAM
jgi:hypothetical protein